MANSKGISLPIQNYIIETTNKSPKAIERLVEEIQIKLQKGLLVGDEVSLKADSQKLVGEVTTIHSRPIPVEINLDSDGSPSSDKENKFAEQDMESITYSVRVNGKIVSSIPGDVLLRTTPLPTGEVVRKFILSKFKYTPKTAKSNASWSEKSAGKKKKVAIKSPDQPKKRKLSKKEGLAKVQRTLDAFVKVKRLPETVVDRALSPAPSKFADNSKKQPRSPSVRAKADEGAKSPRRTTPRKTSKPAATVGSPSANLRSQKSTPNKSTPNKTTPLKANKGKSIVKSNLSAEAMPPASITLKDESLKDEMKITNVVSVTDTVAAGKKTIPVMMEQQSIDSNGIQTVTFKKIGDLVEATGSGARKGGSKNSSGAMKQLTLFDLAKSKSGSGLYDGFASVTPPTPKIVRKYRKAVKEDNQKQQQKCILLAAKEMPEPQRVSLPSPMKSLVQQKANELMLRDKLKSMTDEEKKEYFKERRAQVRDRYKNANSMKSEDSLLTDSKDLPKAQPILAPKGLYMPSIDDIMFVSGFFFSYRSYLVKPETVRYKHFNFDTLMACVGSPDERVQELLVALLQTLFNDFTFSDATEMGVALKDIAVNKSTLPYLLHAAFTLTSEKEGRSEKERQELVQTAKLVEKKEFAEWSALTILRCLKTLCLLILDGQGVITFQEETQRKLTASWRERNAFIKTYAQFVSKQAADNTASNSGRSTPTQLGEESKQPNSLTEALKMRREMAKKSVEERERKQKREQLDRQKEALENNVKEAVRLNTICKRLSPLGTDRNHSRYWQIPGERGLFVEKGWPDEHYHTTFRTMEHVDTEVDTRDKFSLVAPARLSHEWLRYESKESVDSLISCLNSSGFRESLLLMKIREIYDDITSTAKLVPDLPEKQDDGQKISVLASFKEDLVDLEDRIRSGGLGGVQFYDSWCMDLKKALSFDKLGASLLECQKGVYENRLKGAMAPNKKTVDKSQAEDNKEKDLESGSQEDTPKYLAAWQSAVLSSPTISRLYVLIEVLESCIMWEKSVDHAKCRVCKRKGDDATLLLCDGCDLGFHMACMRMTKKDVPEGDWFCPSCKPPEVRKSRNLRNMKEASDSENSEDESSSEEYEELCVLCEEGGDMALCDTCLNSYHTACHQPPLRSVPRLSWTCHACRFGTKMSKKKNFNSSVDTESQDTELDVSEKRGTRTSARSHSSANNKKVYEEYNESETTDVETDSEVQPEPKSGRRGAKPQVKSKSAASSGVKNVLESDAESPPVKRPAGRPRKAAAKQPPRTSTDVDGESPPVKRPAGRPRKAAARQSPRTSADKGCDSVYTPDVDMEAVEISDDEVTFNLSQEQQEISKYLTRTSLMLDRVDLSSLSTKEKKASTEVSHVQLQKTLRAIHSKLSAHRSSWPFDFPVDAEEVPDYYDVIAKPMDLTTVINKMEDYQTASQFVEDIRQMIFNSFDYNKKESKIAKLSVTFEDVFIKLLKKHFPDIPYSKQQTLFGFS